MTTGREPEQAYETHRSSLIDGPDWDALVAAVCEDTDPVEAVERLLAA